MRRHDGSPGCRVAQAREVIRGWALEVSGETAERLAGKVSLSGKSVGETKGLLRREELG